jgi:hypothetical protein
MKAQASGLKCVTFDDEGTIKYVGIGASAPRQRS